MIMSDRMTSNDATSNVLNPNGQWYWIEILTKMPLVRAMVELIEDLALQYQQDC